MIKKIATILLIFVAALSCSDKISKKNAKLDLKLNLEKGDQFKIKMSTDQTIIQNMNNIKQKIDQKIGLVYQIDVLKVDDNKVAELKITYKSGKFEMNGPIKVNYDSEKSKGKVNPLAIGFASVIGKSFFLKVNHKGKILDIRKIDELLTEVFTKVKETYPESSEKLLKALKEQFGKKAIKETMKKMFEIYPQNPIAIGECWIQKINFEKILPMNIHNQFQLKDRKNGIAYVLLNSKIIPNKNAKAIDLGMFKMKYNLKGSQKGMIEIDEDTGITKTAKLNINLKGSILVMGMTIPMNLKGIIKIEEVK